MSDNYVLLLISNLEPLLLRKLKQPPFPILGIAEKTNLEYPSKYCAAVRLETTVCEKFHQRWFYL